MNRRIFCLQLAAAAAAGVKGIAQTTVSSASRDDYALWSQLIECQSQCNRVRGYLIARCMKVPDGLPALPSDSSKPPIAQAIYRMQHPGAAYETAVPLEWRSAFAEAIDEAKQRAQQTVLHERRFVLKKRYRLLSEAEIQEYYSLSPHVVPTQWRLDPRVERKYRGSGGISYLALPSYDGARRLALLWVDSDGGGCANRQWYFFHAQRRRMVAPGLENHGYGGVRVRRKHCPLYALETYVVLEWMTNLPTAF